MLVLEAVIDRRCRGSHHWAIARSATFRWAKEMPRPEAVAVSDLHHIPDIVDAPSREQRPHAALDPHRQHPPTLVNRTAALLLERWAAGDPASEDNVVATWIRLGVPPHLAWSLVRASVAHLRGERSR
jgi:hypothetical protein